MADSRMCRFQHLPCVPSLPEGSNSGHGSRQAILPMMQPSGSCTAAEDAVAGSRSTCCLSKGQHLMLAPAAAAGRQDHLAQAVDLAVPQSAL